MNAVLLTLGVVAALAGSLGHALDLDVTPDDVDRALSIARAPAKEREQFHAPYVRQVNTTFIETAEVISEYRRAVLIAEERIIKGDRMFAYSTTRVQQALQPWKLRVSILVRMRFHPQNNYVGVPNVDIALPGREAARIGVLKDPILALPTQKIGDRLPVLGAVVEGVFDAAALGDGTYEFVISLEKKEVSRVTFDFAALQ